MQESLYKSQEMSSVEILNFQIAFEAFFDTILLYWTKLIIGIFRHPKS